MKTTTLNAPYVNPELVEKSMIIDNGKSIDQPKTTEPKVKPITGVSVLTKLINDGIYTRKELIEISMKSLPHLTKSTVTTLITDSKNPKYSQFAFLTQINADGKYSFTDIPVVRVKAVKKVVEPAK